MGIEMSFRYSPARVVSVAAVLFAISAVLLDAEDRHFGEIVGAGFLLLLGVFGLLEGLSLRVLVTSDCLLRKGLLIRRSVRIRCETVVSVSDIGPIGRVQIMEVKTGSQSFALGLALMGTSTRIELVEAVRSAVRDSKP
jgi:hypothetical protein